MFVLCSIGTPFALGGFGDHGEGAIDSPRSWGKLWQDATMRHWEFLASPCRVVRAKAEATDL